MSKSPFAGLVAALTDRWLARVGPPTESVSFAGVPQPPSLGQQATAVARLQGLCTALAAAILTLALMSAVGLGIGLAGRFDVVPYVADGSQWGCKVPMLGERSQ